MLVNNILFRVLEGYYGPLAKITCLKQRKQREFALLIEKRERLRDKWKEQGEQFPIPFDATLTNYAAI